MVEYGSWSDEKTMPKHTAVSPIDGDTYGVAHSSSCVGKIGYRARPVSLDALRPGKRSGRIAKRHLTIILPYRKAELAEVQGSARRTWFAAPIHGCAAGLITLCASGERDTPASVIFRDA